MGKMGKSIAASMPPPSAPMEPDADDAGADDDMKGAEENAAAELKSALAGGQPAEIADAFKKMMDVCNSY